jgi:hypothetical protein
MTTTDKISKIIQLEKDVMYLQSILDQVNNIKLIKIAKKLRLLR